MILIELTEKEFEIIKFSVEAVKKRNVKLYEEDNFEADRKSVELCDDILEKINLASMAKDDVIIRIKDLFFIKSLAIREFNNFSLPTSLSNIQLEQNDLLHVALIKSLIMWLNGNNLLKRLVQFDTTDNSTQFESIED